MGGQRLSLAVLRVCGMALCAAVHREDDEAVVAPLGFHDHIHVQVRPIHLEHDIQAESGHQEHAHVGVDERPLAEEVQVAEHLVAKARGQESWRENPAAHHENQLHIRPASAEDRHQNGQGIHLRVPHIPDGVRQREGHERFGSILEAVLGRQRQEHVGSGAEVGPNEKADRQEACRRDAKAHPKRDARMLHKRWPNQTQLRVSLGIEHEVPPAVRILPLSSIFLPFQRAVAGQRRARTFGWLQESKLHALIAASPAKRPAVPNPRPN
eukprot:scaffold47_cov258-Pinguiococcus_pyrenoidosus.AAC.6